MINSNLFTPAAFGSKLHSPSVPANQFGPSNYRINQLITKGSLITFNYLYYKNDPYPLLLVSDVNYKGVYCRGVNIHYLTFPDIKSLLQGNANNLNFSYQANLKNTLFKDMFRQFKLKGIRLLKKIDVSFLLNVLASVRTISPNEVEAIRSAIKLQIQQFKNELAQPS